MNEPRSIDASPHGHKVLSVMRAALAAVEPGAAVRADVSRDGDRLIARLLPFSTSLPSPLTRFSLVYQHKGWWIYRLND